MAEKKYYLPVDGELVEVSHEVYKAYYKLTNHADYLEQKDKKKGKVLFSDLDTENTSGEAMLPNVGAVNIEDLAIANLMSAKLQRCVELLTPPDRALIEAIFYDGLSERQYASRIGVSQNTINKRKKVALEKLRNIFKK
ncbi:MAG: sigma factor-like helix-turn-helix DNA-binding protein [Eubacteriales bacterium]|nr:sigma factor-like helix-turn-helix DNA-binding protein [Eubacteriales bacterium]